MSELLGHLPQYVGIDEWEPPDHKWSFESERADWDKFFENHSEEIFLLLLFFGVPTFGILLETNLNEKFWYRVDVQNRITRNVLLLCEPKVVPEHNYYREYIDRLPMLVQNDSLDPTFLLNNFYKAMTSQAEDIDIYRKELDDDCRKE